MSLLWYRYKSFLICNLSGQSGVGMKVKPLSRISFCAVLKRNPEQTLVTLDMGESVSGFCLPLTCLTGRASAKRLPEQFHLSNELHPTLLYTEVDLNLLDTYTWLLPLC